MTGREVEKRKPAGRSHPAGIGDHRLCPGAHFLSVQNGPETAGLGEGDAVSAVGLRLGGIVTFFCSLSRFAAVQGSSLIVSLPRFVVVLSTESITRDKNPPGALAFGPLSIPAVLGVGSGCLCRVDRSRRTGIRNPSRLQPLRGPPETKRFSRKRTFGSGDAVTVSGLFAARLGQRRPLHEPVARSTIRV